MVRVVAFNAQFSHLDQLRLRSCPRYNLSEPSSSTLAMSKRDSYDDTVTTGGPGAGKETVT